MAKDDLYVLTLTSGEPGQLMKQDFAYRQVTDIGGNHATDILVTFISSILTSIRNITQVATKYYSIKSRNLYDNLDFVDLPIVGTPTGQRSGSALPQFNAMSFTSAIPAIGQKPGGKRFGFISETDTAGGNLTDVSGLFDALDLCASLLGADVFSPAEITYAPVIVKRVKYTTPKGKPAYRYPTSPTEKDPPSYDARDWTWDVRITSQITRKIGRGI